MSTERGEFWYCTVCGAGVPRSEDRCMAGHPDPPRNTKSPILSFITSNITDTGDGLSEEEFFDAMASAMKHAAAPAPVIVSPRTIHQAIDDARKAERAADQFQAERFRTRRWRFIKRARLAALEAKSLRFARGLLDTFAPRKYPST